MNREHYTNLDGLRVFSCLGIMAMHIKACSDYHINGWVFDTFISSWTFFVYLFLIISGFGMGCGYYDAFKSGTIDLNSFYIKRYKKILPFFVFLIIIDVAMGHSISMLIEGITEATLVFGLLPNNMPGVIGVGWTLGVIFLFYMLFPFFVWLCWSKKRAYVSFAISIVLNIFCEVHYFTDEFVIDTFAPRHCFLYCAPFFLGGMVIYLNRKEIKTYISKHRGICLGGCIAITLVHYIFIQPWISLDHPGPLMLVVFIPWLSYAISVNSKILSNRVMEFFSVISLEIYLSHMVIYRVVEKAKCLYLFGKGWISYLSVWIAVIVGAVIFIELFKKAYSYFFKVISFN